MHRFTLLTACLFYKLVTVLLNLEKSQAPRMYKAAPLLRRLLPPHPPGHVVLCWAAWSLGLILFSWGPGCLPPGPPGAPNVGLPPGAVWRRPRAPHLPPLPKLREAVTKVADVQHQSQACKHQQAKHNCVTKHNEAGAACVGCSPPGEGQATGRWGQTGSMPASADRLRPWLCAALQLKRSA